MKLIYASGLAIALFLTGCATQHQVAGMQGHGTKQAFNAPFESVWRSTIDAVPQNGLEVLSADRNTGYIAARRTIRVHTFGENVGIWVAPVSPAETSVEVVSRQAGPPVVWLKNWEHEVLRSVAANLTRYPTAVGAVGTTTYSTRGASYPVTTSYAEEQRRLDQLRREEQLRQQQLVTETDLQKRAQLNAEIERLRGQLRAMENRLSELEAEQQRLR